MNPCHGKFGDIWVALGGSFTLSFSFEYTASGAPAELAEFYFSIFDIDQTRNPWKSWQRGGTERIEVSGFSDYALSDPASQSDVDVEDGSQDACACASLRCVRAPCHGGYDWTCSIEGHCADERSLSFCAQ